MASETHRPGVGGDAPLADTLFWGPHASPKSVWPFVLAYPTLVYALYRRNRVLLAGTLLSVVVDLLVVSPPETDDAWATRVVLGERVWLEEGLLSGTLDLGLTAVGGVVNLYTIRAAAKRQPVATVVGTVASMAFMFLFFDRMARRYEAWLAAQSDDGDE